MQGSATGPVAIEIGGFAKQYGLVSADSTSIKLASDVLLLSLDATAPHPAAALAAPDRHTE